MPHVKKIPFSTAYYWHVTVLLEIFHPASSWVWGNFRVFFNVSQNNCVISQWEDFLSSVSKNSSDFSFPSMAAWEQKLEIWIIVSPAFSVCVCYTHLIQAKLILTSQDKVNTKKLYYTDSHLLPSLALWLPFCAPTAWSIHLWPILQGTDYLQLPLKSMEAEHATHNTEGPQPLPGADTYRLETYGKHHRSSHLVIL